MYGRVGPQLVSGPAVGGWLRLAQGPAPRMVHSAASAALRAAGRCAYVTEDDV